MTQVSTSIDDAVDALRSGSVIGIATDTVYGIATDVFLPGADRLLADAKRRSASVPVQVLVSGFEQALSVGIWSDAARRAAGILWPGAVTLVVPRRSDVRLDLGGAGDTIGIRWPARSLAVEVCSRFGPLAATSANHHGETPLRSAQQVAETFASSVSLVLDGGFLSGIASAVVDLTGAEPSVLREGALTPAKVKEALQSADP